GAAAAPKKTIMASGSVSFFFGGGLDSLPREDNSRKITPERLNSHGAFPEKALYLRGVSAKGSKAESINVQLQCGCQEFEATSKDPEGHSVDDLIKEFRSCLSAKVSKTFDISLMGASSKSCEYVLDTLMQVIRRILWDDVFLCFKVIV
ncbi:hypothetical protein Tco_0159741, partial [Tanacetum coccineum]